MDLPYQYPSQVSAPAPGAYYPQHQQMQPQHIYENYDYSHTGYFNYTDHEVHSSSKQASPSQFNNVSANDSSYSNNDSDAANDGQGSKAHKGKVFQCTGFGDCRMVFTRSEHLARHAR
jgi:hypothetical protein